MRSAADRRLEFGPPPQPALLRGFVIALAAHALLLLALTWGVQWKRDTQDVVAEAELWSATAQPAAPRPVEAVPQPPPEPVKVEPPPRPVPDTRQADIALERERQRKLTEAREREEQQERERQKRLEAQKKLEAERKLAEQKKQDDLKKQAQARQAEDQKKADAARIAKAEAEAEKRLETQREENLRRIQGLAGTGAPDATGTAARASGPSESYGGRIQARVRPNIVFGDDISGNPKAEIEVRMAPDGTITSRRIVKSSGSKAWDDAVLRALDRTEVLPRDVDGRVHSPLLIDFRPKG